MSLLLTNESRHPLHIGVVFKANFSYFILFVFLCDNLFCIGRKLGKPKLKDAKIQIKEMLLVI